MKKINFLFTFSFLLIASFMYTSCKKEDAGPQGPAGPAGPTGPTGLTGPKGDTGVANVIYSAWLDVPYLPDTIHVTEVPLVIDTLGFYANITAPKLTNAILTSGEIKVYLNLGTAAQPVIAPLPYFDVYSLVNINPVFFNQTIQLYSNVDASTYTAGGVKSQQYRYILIPGAKPARMVTINWNNYAEVKKYLGLTD